jgi:hypothetical protein
VEGAVAIGGSAVGSTVPDQVLDPELMEPPDDVAHEATSAPAARVSEPVVMRAIQRLVLRAEVIAAFSR